jgi:hypothetical protein
MGLVLDLKAAREVVVENTNPAFEGTDYAPVPFAVVCVPLSRTEIGAIGKQFPEEARAENEIFARQVKSWTGIQDAAGEPLPCDSATLRKVADRFYSFANRVNLAVAKHVEMKGAEAEKEAGN